ncbi:hypothetical protein E0198_003547 [Clavispora lusitaniae]|nr:hypothetical protein E0198_003547 [Clavispora lusitaniae]
MPRSLRLSPSSFNLILLTPKWYPIEYRSKKFDVHQRNWDIHVKEFWAVMFAFRKFRFFLEGHFFTAAVIEVYPQIFDNTKPGTDYEPLTLAFNAGCCASSTSAST